MILVLIQVGGFGVMTFASALGLQVVRRMSYKNALITATETKSASVYGVRAMARGIVKVSLVIEGTAALILTLQFWLAHDTPFLKALWFGVFHAVSAFNNAGFALFSNSLSDFVADPVISLTIASEIILGGLGFPVLFQLRKHLKTPRLWSMHTRLVLAGTAALLVFGTVYITVLEWTNSRTLGSLPWPVRILAGFFHSVQTRTAGFNSVDISQMHTQTWLGMDALMFIGTGPAGTGGGVKITTVGVLLFIVLAELRGAQSVNIFGKRLSATVYRQAVTVAFLAVMLVTFATWLLMFTTDFTLDELLFEAISAFSTVGLSTGITASLPAFGKLVLVVLMFIGRIGPITFATALALRKRNLLYELPEERPIIG